MRRMSSVREVSVSERRVVWAFRVEIWDWVWVARLDIEGSCCCGWWVLELEGAAEGRLAFR